MAIIIKDKRYLGSDGVMYHYCKECCDFKPVYEFNNCTKCAFGKYPLCKQHHRERNKVSYDRNKSGERKPRKKDDMSYLQISFPTSQDYQETKDVLTRMGYDISRNIHRQFLDKIRDKYNIELL